jgi:hypothetical protein
MQMINVIHHIHKSWRALAVAVFAGSLSNSYISLVSYIHVY